MTPEHTWNIGDVLRGAALALAFIGVVAWRIYRSLKKSEDRERTLVKWGLTGVILAIMLTKIAPVTASGGYAAAASVPFLAACAIILGLLWTPEWAGALADRLTSLYTGPNVGPELEAHYSVAQAKRAKGEFKEALWAIQAELAKFPQDATGPLLAADIQALDLKDLPAAEVTLLRLSNQPGQPPPVVAAAINTLADYHLKVGLDPDSARNALQQVVDRFPNTELAQRAAQRIGHLASTKDLLQTHERDRIKLQPGVQNLGLLKPGEGPVLAEQSPEDRACELVAQLEQHPLDNEAREELALIYAFHYHKLDLACGELEQMIAQPDQSPKHVVRWLNIMADLQVKLLDDPTLPTATLKRIGELYPHTAAAQQAEERIARLPNEYRGRHQAEVIKLGTYEQYLGLKKDFTVKHR